MSDLEDAEIPGRVLTAVAVFGGVLAAFATGLMYPYWPPYGTALAGLLPGVVVGCIGRKRWLCALLAAACALVIVPFGVYLAAPVAAAVAWVTRAVIEKRGPWALQRVVLAAMAFVIVSGTAAGMTLARAPGSGEVPSESLAEWLAVRPSHLGNSDTQFFLLVYHNQNGGTPFYDAWRSAVVEYRAGRRDDPQGAVNVREPLAFWVWAALPTSPTGTFTGGLLLLGAMASISAFAAGRCLGHQVLALAAAASVMAYFTFIAASPSVLQVEPWAGAFVLMSLCAWLLHSARERDWAWALASVALALVAVLVRELAVFVLLAGLATSLLVKRERELRTWIPWSVALGIFAAMYWLHIRAVGGGVFSPSMGAAHWFSGSIVPRVWSTWTNLDFFIPPTIDAFLFTVVGIVTAFVIPHRSARTFAILGVVVPMTLMAFIGTVSVPGVPLGSWGALLKPSIWAMLSMSYPLLAWGTPPLRHGSA